MRQAQSFGVSRGEAGHYPPYDSDGASDVIDVADLQRTASAWRTTCQ